MERHSFGQAQVGALPFQQGPFLAVAHEGKTNSRCDLAHPRRRAQERGYVLYGHEAAHHAHERRVPAHSALLPQASAGEGAKTLPGYQGAIRYRHPLHDDTPVFTKLTIDLFASPNYRSFDLSSLRYMSGGGAAMPHAVAERLQTEFGLTFAEGYGLTETAAPTHGNPPERAKLQCLGIPLYGTDSRVVDPITLQEMPVGEVGEIVSRGPMVFEGYWRHPEATAAAFVEVQIAISWVVDNYNRVAEWYASARRVMDIVDACAARDASAPMQGAPSHGASIRMTDFAIADGRDRPLLSGAGFSAASGEAVHIHGESSTGKSTLVRVLAGLWPSAGGAVSAPKPGDIIVTSGHVGLYAGSNLQIDSPVPGKTIQFRAIWQTNPTYVRVTD